jgi:hypothetical protein
VVNQTDPGYLETADDISSSRTKNGHRSVISKLLTHGSAPGKLEQHAHTRLLSTVDEDEKQQDSRGDVHVEIEDNQSLQYKE